MVKKIVKAGTEIDRNFIIFIHNDIFYNKKYKKGGHT